MKVTIKKNIRLFSKLAAESEVRGDEAHRTAVYTSVHEDSSTESTKQFTSAVEFRKKSIVKKIVISLFSILAFGCSNKPSPDTLVVGTISGPETELVDVAQKVAKKRYNLNIKIVEFSDYNLPNEALQDGTLDVNVYQHLPYLEESKKAHNYQIKAIGKTFIYPAGIYSDRFKSLKNLPMNPIIAIPNDPSNEVRALILLAKAKLIKFQRNTTPSIASIISNPKHIRFRELDAAQLPRILEDVDAAVINTNYAIPAGLHPTRDALFIETKDSPYANLIVVKENGQKSDKLALFVKAMNSPEVASKANELFGDSAIAAW